MATTAHRDDIAEDGSSLDDEAYIAWKRAKIERGLAQSQDRSVMIPIEQVWRDLTLER